MQNQRGFLPGTRDLIRSLLEPLESIRPHLILHEGDYNLEYV